MTMIMPLQKICQLVIIKFNLKSYCHKQKQFYCNNFRKLALVFITITVCIKIRLTIMTFKPDLD